MSEIGGLDQLGVTISEEFGSVGTNYVSYGLVSREVKRIDNDYRLAMSVPSSLVMHQFMLTAQTYNAKSFYQNWPPARWLDVLD